MRPAKSALLIVALILLVLALIESCNARKLHKKVIKDVGVTTAAAVDSEKEDSKQLFLFAQSKETSPANFVRLLLMRLVYGIATQLGIEERLAGAFNGAFVPPNADDDYDDFGLSGAFDDY